MGEKAVGFDGSEISWSSRFPQAFARAPVPMLIADADGAVLEANDAFAQMFGYRSAAEVVGRAGMLLFERTQLTRVSSGERSFRARWESDRGELEVTAWAIDRAGEAPAIAVSFACGADGEGNDLRRARRALALISNLRAAAAKTEDVDALLNAYCRTLAEIGGYSLAWIGVGEDDEQRTVRAIARSDAGPSYVDGLRLTWADRELGRGPTGVALREGRTSINADSESNVTFAPWRQAALSFGHRSSIAVPFQGPDGLRAALNVYSRQAEAFDVAEAALLAELALDLEHRLELLRARAAHRKAVAAVEECQARLGAELEARARQRPAAVAHDINNVLTIMRALVGELDLEQSPRSREVIEGLDASIRRTARLTQQLIRPGAAAEGTRDLGAIVAEQRRLLESVMGTRVRLRVDAAQTALPVEIDGELVEQILWNLAINARDAMPEGGALTLATGRSSTHAFLSVSDTGTGIPEDLRARIFERGVTTKGSRGGSGQGLATIKLLVEEHRGWIDVESELGVGSTFTVWLPTSAMMETSAPVSSETILLVEDEPTIRLSLARLLRSLGYRVADVDSIAAAREATSFCAFDMVITDVDLADGTGCELVRELVAERPELSAICISGQARFVRDLPPGTRVLEKPFDVTLLTRLVRECLDRRRR